MTILFIALLIICTMFALVAIAVTRKLTPVVNDKRIVHYIEINADECDDVYNCYKRFEIQKKSKKIEQGDIIKYFPLDKNRVMVSHEIEKRQFQVTDIYDGAKIGCPEYVILSIAPCYYSFKDDNGKKGKK